MTSDGGNLSFAQGEKIDTRAEAIRNLRMAETMLARGSNIAKAVQIELHCRIAAVWSDLAYQDDPPQGAGTPEPCEGVSGAHSASDPVALLSPEEGDRFRDRDDQPWVVVETPPGRIVLVCGGLRPEEYGPRIPRHEWNDVWDRWGPLTPWTDPEPETVPAPVQAPTTTPRTYTHEGVEYVYGVRYIDCEGDPWVIVDTLANGIPFAVAGYQAEHWPGGGGAFTIMMVPTLVLRYGPLEVDLSDPVEIDVHG